MIYLIPDVLTHCYKLKQDVIICGIDDQFNVYLWRGDRNPYLEKPHYYGNSPFPFSNWWMTNDGQIVRHSTAENQIGGKATECQRIIAEQLISSNTVKKSLESAIFNVVGNSYPKFDIKRMDTGQLVLTNCQHILRDIHRLQGGLLKRKYEQEKRVRAYLKARKARLPWIEYVEIVRSGQVIAKLTHNSGNRLLSWRHKRKTIDGEQYLMEPEEFARMMTFVDQHDISEGKFRFKRHGQIEVIDSRFTVDRSTMVKKFKEMWFSDDREGMIIVRFRVNNTQLV